jgi:hypothetical protein
MLRSSVAALGTAVINILWIKMLQLFGNLETPDVSSTTGIGSSSDEKWTIFPRTRCTRAEYRLVTDGKARLEVSWLLEFIHQRDGESISS